MHGADSAIDELGLRKDCKWSGEVGCLLSTVVLVGSGLLVVGLSFFFY